MNRRHTALLTLTLAACSGGNSTTEFFAQPANATLGNFALAVSLPDPVRDVTDFVVTVHNVDLGCSSTPLETLNLVANSDGLPAGVLEVGVAPNRRFAAQLLTLDEGQYLACAQPLQANLAPSAVCSTTEEVFDVVAGQTTGVVLTAQCIGAAIGVTNLVSTLNTAPSVTALSATPSLFPATCEELQLQATAEDPDGDEVQVQWELVGQPTNAVFDFTSNGVEGTLLAETEGTYEFEVTVTDAAGGSSSTALTAEVTAGQSGCLSPSAPFATSLSAGSSAAHNCAIVNDGSIQCWGHGDFGKLGNGSPLSINLPQPVVGLPLPGLDVVQVANGDSHSCALLEDGSVQCWGGGFQGQLGDGDFDNSDVPVPVLGLGGLVVDSIVTGSLHSCAILQGGSSLCWGASNFGQLGNGTFDASAVPGAVSGLENAIVEQIALGDAHSCAIVAGEVQCWGRNNFGQLGDGTTNTSNVPVTVSGLGGVAALQVVAGDGHSCALLADGTVHCWGFGLSGQLGTNGITNSLTPVSVVGLDDFPVAQLSAGENHTCVLSTAGAVRCWGLGQLGRLGSGTTLTSLVPVPVADMDGLVAVELSTNAGGGCVRLDDGSTHCWGSNLFGSLGNGNNVDALSPVPLAPFVP